MKIIDYFPFSHASYSILPKENEDNLIQTCGIYHSLELHES